MPDARLGILLEHTRTDMAKKKQVKRISPVKAGQKKPPLEEGVGKNITPATGAQKPTKVNEPSRPTVKRLFAVSGNRCAFPNCPTCIVDETSGSIICQICHIKGENRDSARHDPSQSDAERHGHGNLILLCGPHHKIIDDDEQTYTVVRLQAMKKEHLTGQHQARALTTNEADRLIKSISNNMIADGSIISALNQSGGQAAHSIVNHYQQPQVEDEQVQLEGSLSIGGTLELIQRIGCPGLEFRVIGRSKREAKIRRALFCAEGRGFLAAFEKGFGASFGHEPPPGLENETLQVALLPLSRPDTPEGFTLGRDDVRRFYLPLCVGGLGLFLTQPANNISVRVEFLDRSEKVLLTGALVQDTLQGLFDSYNANRYTLNVSMNITLRASSRVLPRTENLVGTVNPHLVELVDPSLRPTPKQKPPDPNDPSYLIMSQSAENAHASQVAFQLAVVGSNIPGQYTLGVEILDLRSVEVRHLTVAFVADGHFDMLLHEITPSILQPRFRGRSPRNFVVPFTSLPELLRIVGVLSQEQFAFLVRTPSEEVLRVPGECIQGALRYLQEVVNPTAASGC